MRLFKIAMLLLFSIIKVSDAFTQATASVNILTQNSGQVPDGNTVYIQVTVGSTGPTTNIGVNKVRAAISIPAAIAAPVISASQDGLPPGWTILSNSGGVITICNGSDVIPVGEARQIYIKVQGNVIGGPSTV